MSLFQKLMGNKSELLNPLKSKFKDLPQDTQTIFRELYNLSQSKNNTHYAPQVPFHDPNTISPKSLQILAQNNLTSSTRPLPPTPTMQNFLDEIARQI